MAQSAHVTFIHGLANKPPVEDLRRLWLEALAAPVDGDEGFDLPAAGVTVSFVYWADLFYDVPMPVSEYESRGDELALSVTGDVSLPDSQWVRAMQSKFPDEFDEAPVEDDAAGYERVPLPGFVKRRLMRHFVREAHDYLFDVNGIRETIRRRAMEDLGSVPATTRHVLVGHSQGSFIAYDVLTGIAESKPVDGLLTLGSPLGIDEIQERLVWTRQDGYPKKLRGDWVNMYDAADVVARLDPVLANDFLRQGVEAVTDVNEQNYGVWRHAATKYFKGPKLRSHLRRLCGREEA